MADKSRQPGASELEILEEPDWTQSHSHWVGTRGRDNRFMGMTHTGDEWYEELAHAAQEKFNDLREKVKRGELVTVRDMMAKQQVHPNYVCLPHEGASNHWIGLPH